MPFPKALFNRLQSVVIPIVITLCCSLPLGLGAEQRLNPPVGWAVADPLPKTQSYSLLVAEFPSRVLAASLAESIESLGWYPVEVLKQGDKFGVYVGKTESLGVAEYHRLEMISQKVAEPQVVSLEPAQAALVEATLMGPLRSPFTDDLGYTESWFRTALVQNRLQEQVAGLPIANPLEVMEVLVTYLNREVVELERGDAAGEVLATLYEHRILPEESFFLARLLAARELPASDETRLLAMEVCAELYQGHFKDWRRAWATNRLLQFEQGRTPAGLIRDQMRQLGLQVELQSRTGSSYVLDFPAVRAELRTLYDRVPVEDPRLGAKVELFFLQTYAWEGNWDRVNELGRQYINRNQAHKGELAAAQILYARSFEQTLEYSQAIAVLEGLSEHLPTRSEALYHGFEQMKVNDLQFKWITYFQGKERELILRGVGEVAKQTQ